MENIKEVKELNLLEILNKAKEVPKEKLASIKVEGPLYVMDASNHTYKTNKTLLAVTFMDKNKNILPGVAMDAKLGSADEIPGSVYIKGKMNYYNEEYKIIFEDYRYYEMEELTLVNKEAINKRIKDLVDQVTQPQLHEMLEDIFIKETPEKIKHEVTSNAIVNMKTAPAAVWFHHNYKYGLLEHIAEVAELSLSMAKELNKHTPGFINEDVIITGAMLHDIGKSKVYSFDKGKACYDKFIGGMLEHLSYGYRQMCYLSNVYNINETIAVMLEHIILSHHSKLEYGSPVTPKIIEAEIIARADSLSATFNKYKMSGDEPYVGRVSSDGKQGFTPSYLKSLITTNTNPQL